MQSMKVSKITLDQFANSFQCVDKFQIFNDNIFQAETDDLYQKGEKFPQFSILINFIFFLTNKFQAETDDLYKRCSNFNNVAKEANTTSDKLDAEIRDLSKKVRKSLLQSKEKYNDKDKDQTRPVYDSLLLIDDT